MASNHKYSIDNCNEGCGLSPEQRLIADVIKLSLKDLYGKSKKLRIEAELFFHSKLFELTGLSFEKLKKEYERIHHIRVRQ